jgi:surface polysaccharide O-acyltransferase-like enzyme
VDNNKGSTAVKSRILYADALRIVAIFAVVTIHVAARYWDSTPPSGMAWQSLNLWDSLSRWCIPVFVMLSGMLNLSKPIATDLKTEFARTRKKCLRLLSVLVIWSIVYLLYSAMTNSMLAPDTGFGVFAFIVSLKTIVFGPAYYHLWFLYMIIGLYLLTPLIKQFLAGASRQLIRYAIILFILIGACIPFYNAVSPFVNAVIPFFPEGEIYFPLVEVSGYVGYYLAGYYFFTYQPARRTKNAIYLLGILSLVFTIVASAAISVRSGEANQIFYNYLLVTTCFEAFAVFLLAKQLLGKPEFDGQQSRFLSKVLPVVSKAVFGVYLVHVLVLRLWMEQVFGTLAFWPILSVPVIAVIVFAISLGISLLLNKIPKIAQWIV